MYLVTGDSRSWEGDYDPTEFVTNISKNFTTSGYKISVMLRIHSHCLLYNLVKILDPGFKFIFSSSYCLLGTQNCNDFPILILFAGEYDSGSGLVSDRLDIDTLATYRLKKKCLI